MPYWMKENRPMTRIKVETLSPNVRKIVIKALRVTANHERRKVGKRMSRTAAEFKDVLSAGRVLDEIADQLEEPQT